MMQSKPGLGGGIIALYVGNNIHIDGDIIARGGNGSLDGEEERGGGGGSGGSILVVAFNMSGHGRLDATGGCSSNPTYGSGAGGLLTNEFVKCTF